MNVYVHIANTISTILLPLQSNCSHMVHTEFPRVLFFVDPEYCFLRIAVSEMKVSEQVTMERELNRPGPPFSFYTARLPHMVVRRES